MKVVVKLGGAALDNKEIVQKFATSIASLATHGHKVVVVHGGGAALTRTLKELGRKSEFINGLRVTDSETRDVAVMVLAGHLNKQLVAAIGRTGQPALGLCGGDLQCMRASKRRGEVDLGFGDLVDIVRPRVERHMQDDLDDLCVVVTGLLDGPEIGFAHMTALARDLDGETHCGIGLRIVRRAVAVGGHLGVVEFRDVLAEIGVRRKTIRTAVDLGDRESDTLMCGRGQRAFVEGAEQRYVTFQCSRTVGYETEDIRRDAQFLLDGIEQRLRCGRSRFYGGGGVDT